MTVLGIDTSNYRTSAALVSDKDGIIMNYRKLLPVPSGERGLRQNEAVFAHLKQLAEAAEELQLVRKEPIDAVAASISPCDGADSYMPVFQVGASFGRFFAAAAGIPFIETTHQRGHLAAATMNTKIEDADEYLALHLSGGTTDLLEVRKKFIVKIGGSLDLHAGQLVDRAGVAMGFLFPAGPELEKMAESGISEGLLGCSMENNDLFCHISGAESQVQRWINDRKPYRHEKIAREIFDFLARTTARMLIAGRRLTGLHIALVTGGIASSALFRKMLYSRTSGKREVPEIVFGQPEMSGDNAVGVARIGMKILKTPG